MVVALVHRVILGEVLVLILEIVVLQRGFRREEIVRLDGGVYAIIIHQFHVVVLHIDDPMVGIRLDVRHVDPLVGYVGVVLIVGEIVVVHVRPLVVWMAGETGDNRIVVHSRLGGIEFPVVCIRVLETTRLRIITNVHWFLRYFR